jgi:protein TonB
MGVVTTITSAMAVIGASLLYSNPDFRENINAHRFGFEGPEQYVRRIQLSSLGDPSSQRSTPQIVQPKVQKPQRKGGGGDPTPDADIGTPAQDLEAFRPPGVGDSEADIMARAMLRAGSTPLFQSRELVIEHLVEPEYPQEARDRGIEGKVAVLALVDERGRVSDAEIVGTPGDFTLENAALEAVMQCRFKPFQMNGESQEVYAMFRFAFRLVN